MLPAVCGAEEPPGLPANRPIEVPANGYVGSDACRSCHPGRHASWYASYHRTMTQVATPEAVVGRFDGEPLRRGAHRVRMLRDGEGFAVEVEGPRGRGGSSAREPVRHPVVLTTGSHHEQFYWYAAGPGRRLGLAGFVYLIGPERWLPYSSVGLGPEPPAGAPLAPAAGAWNAGCMHCHATNGRTRLDRRGSVRAAARPMDTQVSEFGIACEACHGPGAEHVQLNRDPQRRYEHHMRGAADASIVNPTRLDPRRSSQVCGQCHSVHLTFRAEEGAGHLNEHGMRFRPGEELEDTRELILPADRAPPPYVLRDDPAFLRERFWSDGIVRVSGREYTGMVASPCFARGESPGEISCLSCHTMHPAADDDRPLGAWADDQLRPGMRGDAACVQCHADVGAEAREHTRHAPEGEGARCMNCHMSYTSYGLLKAIRSHAIETPSVQASLATGRPNACNQCHLDRSLGWAADQLQEGWGVTAPKLDERQRGVPASALWLLAGDAGQRALMAWSMGWAPAQEASGREWLAGFLPILLTDPYPAVRYIAGRSMRTLPGFEALEYDSEAAPAQRERVRGAALDQWRAQRRQAGLPVDASDLLDDSAGALPRDVFLRLLMQRDDRRLVLRE